ncbi:hypothetical protein [Streptomyces sp. NPDC004830]
MSYSLFLLRFRDGEAVPLGAERLRQVTQPYVVVGGADEDFSQLRGEDGGGADLYRSRRGGDGMSCVTATHVTTGAMTGVLARLATALGAVIVPQDGPALIFDEDDRRHLPAGLREGGLVIAPTADALHAAIRAL